MKSINYKLFAMLILKFGKYNYRLIAFSIVALGLSSCNKFVTIGPPPNQVITSTVFTSDASAASAMVGLYSQIMNGVLFNGNMSVYPGLSSDELYNTDPGASAESFTKNAILPDDATIEGIWTIGYNYIYQTNAMIEGLVNATGMSTDTKKQLQGEAHFMRAFCYFYLVNLFGDLPLETSTSYEANKSMSRTPSGKVYEQIINDLLNAQDSLSSDYVTDGRVRPNKWAATALLARVYLYEKNWVQAEQMASAVINAGLYSLSGDLHTVFLGSSEEAIWQLLPVQSGFNTGEGYTFIPSSSTVVPTYALTNDLFNSFEPGDLRKTDWLDSNSVNGMIYYYPYKYKVALSPNVTEYNMVLRLGEQYLIRAEARAEQDNFAGAVADLNIIRKRAGLPDAAPANKTVLLLDIEHERQVELFCEWGHRWFDLKRTGREDAVLGAEKSGWKPFAALYPIPEAEIQSNPALTQNSGY